jgi:hypothetical protein
MHRCECGQRRPEPRISGEPTRLLAPATARETTDAAVADSHPPVAPGLAHEFSQLAVHAPLAATKVSNVTPHEPFEREADEIAGTVMRRLAPTATTTSTGRHPVTADATPPKAPATIAGLAGQQGRGEPLPPVTRREMEDAFGYDFSRVRIHRDAEANETSEQLSALAFTHGSHVYFGRGRYDPVGSSGKYLLAHELAHVVQQGRAAASAPIIQRFAYFSGRAIHETSNLAETALYDKDVGLTFPVVNDSPATTDTQMRAAFKRPTVEVSPAASGDGFEARVKTTEVNKVSADATVLGARRWTLEVPKSTVRKQYPHLTACKGSGKTTFRAFGDPSEAAMFAASRRHEDRHFEAIWTAFFNAIYYWDTEVDVAAGSRQVFHGSTEAEARAALYKAVGGTPDDVVDRFAESVATEIDKYHGTPEGGPVVCDSETAETDATCATASVKCTNPS